MRSLSDEKLETCSVSILCFEDPVSMVSPFLYNAVVRFTKFTLVAGAGTCSFYFRFNL